MQAEFHYELTEQDHREALRILGFSRSTQQRWRKTALLLGLAIPVAGVAIARYFEPAPLDSFVLLILVTAIPFALLQAFWSRQYLSTLYNPATSSRSVAFDDHGIVERTDIGTVQWGWAGLAHVHEMENAVVLESADRNVILLPNRLWESADGRSELVKQIRERATKILPDLPDHFRQKLPRPLLIVGSIAAGLELPFVVAPLFYLAGVEHCSCEFRQSLTGLAFFLAQLVALLLIIAVTLDLLVRLERHRPKAAHIVAVSLIGIFAASNLLLAARAFGLL